MAIRTQSYLQRTKENRLFRQLGFQVESEKTNGIILANMHLLEKLLDAGKLKDLDGNVNTEDAVIRIFMRVSKVREGGTVQNLDGLVIEDADGNPIDLDGVAGGDAESQDDSAPFEV